MGTDLDILVVEVAFFGGIRCLILFFMLAVQWGAPAYRLPTEIKIITKPKL